MVFFIKKSMASLFAGVLVSKKLIRVQRPIADYLPKTDKSAYSMATIRHLLDA